jgi:hypothetical protein
MSAFCPPPTTSCAMINNRATRRVLKWLAFEYLYDCVIRTGLGVTLMPIANPVLSVCVTPDERNLLAAAAEHAHTNLSDFVRRKQL